MRYRYILNILVAFTFSISRGVLPASAQPGIIDPDTVTDVLAGITPEQRDQKAWDELRKQTIDKEKADPQAAVDIYKTFFDQHPKLSPSVAISVTQSIARLWRDGLKNNDKAYQIYDWALGKYKDDPNSLTLLTDYSQTLLQAKRPQDVETLLQAHWDQITHGWRHMAVPVFHEWANALEQQNKDDDLISLIEREFVVFPSLAQGDVQFYEWMTYDRLTNALIKKKRVEEALGWAKLRFMVAAFDPDQIDRATRMLVKVWSSVDPERKGLQDFAEAQKDLTKPNPLTAVKLPHLDADVLKQTLARLPSGREGASERIILLLWEAQPAKAMNEAKKLLGNNTSKDGALEVCRVFKATDFNIKRANAFLMYLKTPTGPNPIDEYMKAIGG